MLRRYPFNGLPPSSSRVLMISNSAASHLRKFTKMRAEDGRVLMLRFYDPVTFADLLEVMPPSQVAELHGRFRVVCIQENGNWSCTEAMHC